MGENFLKADFLDNETYRFIYSAMKHDNALILRTCLETGLRVGDVCALPRSALVGNKIKYTAQKTGKSGTVEISADLARRLSFGGGKWLFPSPKKPGKHRTRQAVWRDMTIACKRLDLAAHGSPHSARKTFAVDLFHDKGLNAVQKALQHDKIDTTMIYAFSDILSKNGLKNAKNAEKTAENIDFRAFAEAVADAVVERLKELKKDGFFS